MAATTLDRDRDNAAGRELMARAQAGDADAFGELYTTHRRMVYATAYGCHPQQAEDITQDVFVRALASLHHWTDQGRGPGAWLKVITRNLCRDVARANRIRPVDVVEEVPEPPPAPDPSGRIVDRLLNRQLVNLVGTLEPDQHQALVLYYLHDLSAAQVADRMGLEPAKVRMLLFRARRAMATLLAEVADV